MKKIFLVLLVFCTCSSSVLFSQGIVIWTFKNRAELVLLSCDNTPSESFDNRLGFHLGVIVKYKVTDIFGFSAEMLYSQKGMSYQYDGSSFFLVPATYWIGSAS